jgi:phenylacetate-CoA ligase
VLRAASAAGFALRAMLGRRAHKQSARLSRHKLRALLKHAASNVPYYRELFRSAGIEPKDLDGPEVLDRLPISTKDELRAAGSTLLSERHKGAPLKIELTSGSSGQPFATYCDREYVLARNLRFLRALLSTGYRPGHRLMLIAERPGSRLAAARRWYYCPLYAPSEEHARWFNEVRPDYLYGSVTPLRLLAQRLLDDGPDSFRRPDCVVTKGEMLDTTTRRLLETAFKAPVLDFYGLTETGLVAWQHRRDPAYAIAADGVVVEKLPVEGTPDRFRLIVTNLDLWAMPIIRYDTGDIGVFAQPDSDAPSLVRVEGRSADCVVGRGGEIFSPFQLTTALQHLHGVVRFRVRQTSVDHIEVDLQSDAEDAAHLETEAIAQLARVLGTGFTISLRLVDGFAPGPSGKFRVVESAVKR